MADFAGFVVDASGLPSGIDHYAGALIDAQSCAYGIDHYVGNPIRTLSLWWTDRDGSAQITLGSATLASDGTVVTPAVTGELAVTLGAATLSSSGTVASAAIAGQLAVTLGALSVASAGTVAEFVPSRERTKRVPSWPRVLLAENPDRVIELYRPPRTVRTAA